jgi:hypothetical protein
MLRALLAACCLYIVSGCDQAEAKRVALVIGNSAYRTVSPLANPQNDARLVANALAALGFDVQMGIDLDKKGIETALKEFALDAMQADIATVYFAGHGLEASGANWLLPVDAEIGSINDIATAAIPFEMVAASLAGASVKIIALDACRNNPYAVRLQLPGEAINRGLAEVELDGYMIIYAAAAGQVALDGDVNSPFALTLARWIGEQNIDLRLLAGKIRDDVIAATAGAQRPFVSASLPGQVTTLAAGLAGQIREAAKAQFRMPYYFDYVRTLRDSACKPGKKSKCQTETMVEADGRIITVDDDAMLRIWDTASEAVASTIARPANPIWPVDVTFIETASTYVITARGDIVTVPLDGRPTETHTIEHKQTPEFLLAAGAPAVAVYSYPKACQFAFVDLSSFALVGTTPWTTACMSAQIEWSLLDRASDRFAMRVATARMQPPYKIEELLLVSYRSREVLCRVEGGANSAAFDAAGDLYTAHDDGTIVRRDSACGAKQNLQLSYRRRRTDLGANG